jgi:hypothetical protein
MTPEERFDLKGYLAFRRHQKMRDGMRRKASVRIATLIVLVGLALYALGLFI